MKARVFGWAIVVSLAYPQNIIWADSGLITMPSKYSVKETIQRFEAEVVKNGWIVFTELDHSAAAKKYGLELRPRTVIVFGNPKSGTPAMQKAPTLAIDVPPKVLVWEDDRGKVWLTFNTGEYLQDYIYPRHALPSNPAAAKAFDQNLKRAAEAATE